MLANRHDHLLFTLMLGVGLLSGCEQEPAEIETMFPDGPYLHVSFEQEEGAPEEECVTQCCDVPEDGKVVLDIEVTNWILAPHEECGDEPQCGPVVITLDDTYGRNFDIETVEPTVTLDARELAAGQDPMRDPNNPFAWDWHVFSRVVPREPVDYPLGTGWITIDLRDETGRIARDHLLCNRDDDRFTVFAEFGPTTAPGTYVARVGLDDVEVVCELEVFTNAEGLAELTWFVDPCTPADVVRFDVERVEETAEAPAGQRKLTFLPRGPVERASLAISRDGEILVEGSIDDVAGELTSPAGAACTIVPCQIAESLGLTL
jgi:hypothetical protein